MSNRKVSKGKFSKFVSSKGFYIAIAVCLVGAGTATWLAVDRTITGIEDNNNQMIESEQKWNEFPKLEEAEKRQTGEAKPSAEPRLQPESSQSSSSSSSGPSGPVSKPAANSDSSEAPASSPKLAYALPIKSEIITPYSNGELVKNITLNDWRTHDGVDIASDKGTDVLATADGVVADIKNDPLWGTVVTIDHADGNQSVYCGLEQSVPVQTGDSVMVRQVIGKLDGVPCEISLPTHLHFAMKRDGKWIDPLSVLQKEITED